MAKRYPTVEEKRAHCLQMMKEAEASLGPAVRFRPVANEMAAGPCPGCLAIAERTYGADEAPLMPLPACPHPDQCIGFYLLERATVF